VPRLVAVLALLAVLAPLPAWCAEPRPARLELAALRVCQAVRQTSAIARQPGLTWRQRLCTMARAITRSVASRKPGAVLLYQGAFDPVHDGHITNLRAALTGVPGVTELFVVPTSTHPGKNPVPFADRVAMLRAAISDAHLPSTVRVSVVDDPHLARLSLAGFDDLTGMIHTKHPGAPLYIMTGADAFLSAERQGLVRRARRGGYRYAVTPRAGYELPSRLPAGVERMSLAGGSESSTRIREAIAGGKPPTDLSVSTLAYILEHGLYGAARAAPPVIRPRIAPPALQTPQVSP
jgi:nicotinic acid mononucleotide adenylyltransferase